MLSEMSDADQPAAATKAAPWTTLTLDDVRKPIDPPELLTLVQAVLDRDPSAIDKFATLFYPLCIHIARRASTLINLRRDTSFTDEDLTHWAWLYIVNGTRLDSDFNYSQCERPLLKWLRR